ncbi:MAG: Asp-tRNA(Asn)/Glu-tRNA(Gln) amidotransferase subunit GatA [Cyclobacteriaceae bacterium]|nr:Asp-tRNA(Asn)/Glu-tRNA(Gln) amidotransferase subunit GatA [Cyclobacteriaceae bacterium]
MINYGSFRAVQEALRHGTISCRELVLNFLQNINQNKSLNAFLDVFEESALQQADIIDQKLKNNIAGPLAGLVVGIKDVFAYQKFPLQAGSKILDGYSAAYTATCIQRLLDADAIIIGRQNCDEFGMGSSNENSAFGSVKNFLDNTRVPGGSSGGSAVAVQAQMCHLSLGSDTGGSVRQPASFCGLIGLKPTYSRISRHGLVAYASSFDCVGLIAHEVETIAKVLSIVAGKDDFDSTVSSEYMPDYATSIQENKNQTFKFAYSKQSIEHDGIQPEVKQAFSSAIEQIKKDGHQVNEINLPLQPYALPTYYILTTAEASSNLNRYDGIRYGASTQTSSLEQQYKRVRTDGFGEEVKRRILLGTFVLSSSYYDSFYSKAQKVRQLIRQETIEVFKQYDFLISPTAPTTAFKLGEKQENPLTMYLADVYSVYANIAGIPAISVPCGSDLQNLPIGLQIMAADFQEIKLLSIAHRLKEKLKLHG